MSASVQLLDFVVSMDLNKVKVIREWSPKSGLLITFMRPGVL